MTHPVPAVLGHSYPRHAAAFACAQGWGARMVRRGKSSHSAMCEALRLMVRSLAPESSTSWPAEDAIVYALRVALDDACVQAVLADDGISCAVAPLLDARAAPSAVRRVARSAAAGRLDADEIEAILRREAAWWVRLHAAIPELHEADHAA